MAVIYEVNLSVRRAIEVDYRTWLATHIREMLALPGFSGAEVFDLLEPAPPADEFALCVRYQLEHSAALVDYLRDHAPRMRSEGTMKFGDKVSAERRVMRSA